MTSAVMTHFGRCLTCSIESYRRLRSDLIGTFREPILHVRYGTMGPSGYELRVCYLPQKTRACAVRAGGPIGPYRMCENGPLKVSNVKRGIKKRRSIRYWVVSTFSLPTHLPMWVCVLRPSHAELLCKQLESAHYAAQVMIKRKAESESRYLRIIMEL